MFLVYSPPVYREFYSFPTRRSSDLAWPSHPELWAGDLLARARQEVANMVNAIAVHQPFYVVAYGEEAVASAKADRKSTRLNSSHVSLSYAVFCLKKTDGFNGDSILR